MKAIIISICVLGCYGCIAAEAIMFDHRAAVLAGLALICAGVASGMIE